MTLIDIAYTTDRSCLALGRNGRMNQIGMSVSVTNNRVRIEPINTRCVGSAYQEIPVEDVPVLINVLRNISESNE